MEKENVILNFSFDFVLDVISYCELLEENKRFVISHQLLKSGTSIGENIRDTKGAESKNDFIHKLKIACKEAKETEYWLLLCEKSTSYPSPAFRLEKIIIIKKLLSKIIYSSKNSLK